MAKEKLLSPMAIGIPAEPQSSPEGALPSPRLTEVMAEAVSDEFCRRIISSSVARGKTVDEICDEESIPRSTCYRRVRQLVDEGAMVVERIVLTTSGKRYAVYRSTFSRMDVRLENGVVWAYATLNPPAADKLRRASHRLDSSCSPPQRAVFRHAPRRRFTSRSGVS